MVLIERIRYLIEEKNVNPSKILLTTFTLKSASELKTKLIKKIGTKAEPIQVSNIHSFCHSILEKYSDYHNFGDTFDVLDEGMQSMFLRNHLEELDIREGKFKDIIEYIGKCGENCISPDILIDRISELYPNRNNFIKISKSYKRYIELLEENKKLDFSGLQRIVLNLLEENNEVLEDIRNNIDFILVDEYQDTNPIQDKIFELIAKPKCNICAVGDDDQSIYSFRGADIDNFIKFSEKFAGTRIIKLDTNFRSTSKIVDISEKFINNYRIMDKQIKPHRELGNDPILIISNNEENEAKQIIETIKEMRKNGIIPHYGYIALLFRSVKHDAKWIISELEDQTLPYTVREDPMFLKREEIRTLLYLFYYIDPKKDYEGRLRRKWRRWWNNSLLENEVLNLVPETINVINTNSEETDISELLTTEEFNNLGIFNENDIKTLSRLNKLKVELFINKNDVLTIFYKILKITGFLNRILNSSNEEDETKVFYLARLSSIVNKYNYLADNPSIEDFLKFLHNLPRKLFYDEKLFEDPKSIKLMTIHQAKGLEFPVVFICGVDNKKFKISSEKKDNYPIPEDLLLKKTKYTKNEEARVFYVAMTRAQDNLVISTSKNEDRKSKKDYSPFITKDIGIKEFSDVNSIINPCDIRTNIIEPLNINYSAIQTYDTCPYLYKMNNYYKFEIEPTSMQKYGIILHKSLHKLHQAMIKGQISEKIIIDIVNKCWVKIYDTFEEDNDKKRILTKNLMKYYSINKNNIKRIISTEESFSLYINNILISGRIDLIMENKDNELELVDFKVSGKKNYQMKAVENQLKVYKYALNENYTITKISTYHFIDNKKTFFDSPDDEIKKIKIYLDSICEKIMNEEFNRKESTYCSNCFFNFCCVKK